MKTEFTFLLCIFIFIFLICPYSSSSTSSDFASFIKLHIFSLILHVFYPKVISLNFINLQRLTERERLCTEIKYKGTFGRFVTPVQRMNLS
jgi:hypothetical protein